MKNCHKCSNEWGGVGQPKSKETCAKCDADLHCCLNCALYDEHKPYECMEPNIDPVRDKERFNYCEEFQFNEKLTPKPQLKNSSKEKEAFKKLFKN